MIMKNLSINLSARVDTWPYKTSYRKCCNEKE